MQGGRHSFYILSIILFSIIRLFFASKRKILENLNGGCLLRALAQRWKAQGQKNHHSHILSSLKSALNAI